MPPARHAPSQGQEDNATGISRGNSDASSHTANGVSRAGGNMKAPYEPAALYATAPAMQRLSPQQPMVAQAYTPLPEKVTRWPKLAVKASLSTTPTGALTHSGIVAGAQRQAALRLAIVQYWASPSPEWSLMLHHDCALSPSHICCSARLLLCRSRARALQRKSPQGWMTLRTWG